MERIRISARKREDVKTLCVNLMSKSNITLKFKVKLYSKDANGGDKYYHKEYVYGNNNNSTIAVDLDPYIEIKLIDDDKNKQAILLREVQKCKFLRKLKNIIGLLEAYNDDEIELLTVNSMGTMLNPKLRDVSTKSFKIGTFKITVGLVYVENEASVKVKISTDLLDIVISMYTFLDMIYMMREVNQYHMAMELINYLGRPALGEYSVEIDGGLFKRGVKW